MIRRVVLAVLLAGLVTACDRITSPTTIDATTTTFNGILPPPDIGPPIPTTTTTVPTRTYRGFLPNGSEFIVNLPGDSLEPITAIGGWFVHAGASGLAPVGEVRYRPIPGAGVEDSYDDGLLRLASENWVVEVLFRNEILTELGDTADEVITSNIALEIIDKWPVLRLSSPFTWGVASPVRPTVGFRRFLVRDGCDSSAVACSENGAVQILALEDGDPGAPSLPEEHRAGAWIETSVDLISGGDDTR